MRNRNGRAAQHEPLECDLDKVLALGVECAARLVQQQHPGVLQQRARNGHALPLAAAEAHAALAHKRLVLVRQRHDEVVRVRCARRALDLGKARGGRCKGNVVADRVCKEHGLLQHKA